MQTGMGIGMGFCAVLLLNFLRSPLFDAVQSDRADLAAQEPTRD